MAILFFSSIAFADNLYILDNQTKIFASNNNLSTFTIGKKTYLYSKDNYLDNNSSVKKIAPFKRSIFYIPNDTFFDEQWGLNNTGQYGYLTDFDIDWPEAIDIYNSISPEDVIVAILDTGVAWNHPDLKGNILTGGDFGNYGFNFCPSDNITDTYDYVDHGTHIAGIISALADNNFGIAGITDNRVKILNLKVTCSNEETVDYIPELRAISKILELVNKGYNIKFVNMSFGGVYYDSLEYEAIQELLNKGVYVFAAAGNDGVNEKNYPAALNNVVSVGAVSMDGQLSDFSNFGDWVDIYAPGEYIISTYNDYLAKPESLNLLDNYLDFYRNEFNGLEDLNKIQFSSSWSFDSGSFSITLDNTSSCTTSSTKNTFITTPFKTTPDKIYRYNKFVTRINLPSSGSKLNIYWSDDGVDWNIMTNQSGFNNSDYFYFESTLPSQLLNSDNISFKFCFEGNAGDKAFVDAIRVSLSDTPDAFLFESGTSMATPFVTAAAALSYLDNGFFDPEDLSKSGDALYDIKAGEIKKLNLYSLLRVNTPQNIPSNNDSGGGGGGCFIATATYGSYLAPEVVVLRQFRDNFLLKYEIGKKLVKIYYKYSPKYANIIRSNSTLKFISILILTPIVLAIKYPIYTIIFALAVLVSFILRMKYQRLFKLNR